MLVFKFALSSANRMANMTHLFVIVPYYIDLVGRYKLSTHGRTKVETARVKVAHEVYKELHNARQEAIQRKKEERRKMLEEIEAKLSVKAIQKKEEKDCLRQLKKSMPKNENDSCSLDFGHDTHSGDGRGRRKNDESEVIGSVFAMKAWCRVGEDVPKRELFDGEDVPEKFRCREECREATSR
eukprot:Gb_01275 [translate_table: standard]